MTTFTLLSLFALFNSLISEDETNWSVSTKMDFHEIWYFEYFSNIFQENSSFIKIGQE